MKVYFAVIFLIFNFASPAQTAESLIRSVQKKFKTVDNFSAQIRQSKLDGANYSGKFYYAKGNKYRIEFKNFIIVSDGKSVWNYNKKINRVVITNLNENPDAFSFEKFVFDFPGKCKTELIGKNGNNYYVKFTPLDDELGFDWAAVEISPDSLINKIEISDYSGNIFKVELKNIKINRNLSGNTFVFKAKNGVKIVDLR